MTDLLLLALLFDGPRYGYQLKKEAGIALGQAALHNNLVYPLLARFHARGWVRRKERGGERGQTRQLYTLTPAGKAELHRRLSWFTEKAAAKEAEFHLRVSLFSLTDAAARQRIVNAREAILTKREERLREIAGHFGLNEFAGAVMALRRKQIRNERNWLRALRRAAERGR